MAASGPTLSVASGQVQYLVRKESLLRPRMTQQGLVGRASRAAELCWWSAVSPPNGCTAGRVTLWAGVTTTTLQFLKIHETEEQ